MEKQFECNSNTSADDSNIGRPKLLPTENKHYNSRGYAEHTQIDRIAENMNKNCRDNSQDNEPYSTAEKTRKLLRDFLAKAEAAKAKQKADAYMLHGKMEIPSAPKKTKIEVEDLGNNYVQTPVIKSEIKQENNFTDNSWSRDGTQMLHNSPPRIKEEPSDFRYNSTSENNVNNISWNIHNNVHNTAYLDEQLHKEKSLHLYLNNSSEQYTPYDYSMNAKYQEPSDHSDKSSLATSPVSFVDSSPKTPTEGNVLEISSSGYDSSSLKMTPRHLKKAWLDRHTVKEDIMEEANYANTQLELNTDNYINGTTGFQNGSHDKNGTSKLNGCKPKSYRKQKEKSINGKRIYARKLFPKDKVARKALSKNIVMLDETGANILNKAKKFSINNNKILNNKLMNDFYEDKKNLKSFDDRKPIKKEYDDDTKSKSNGKNSNKKEIKKFEYTFLQDGPCFQVAPKLSKCRECRWTQNQDLEDVNNIFCRFFSFRKLRYTKNLVLATAGFSNPYDDPSKEDITLWLPHEENLTGNLDLEMSHFILRHVGDQFCDLVEQEKQAAALNVSDDGVVAWKKLVKGVREMCDVCETTLFNVHWTCAKCGFIVCLDCYKHRLNDTGRLTDDPDRDHDEFNWLLCTNRSSHELSKLMLTQIIPANSLDMLGKQMHSTRSLWNFEQNCACPVIDDKIKDEANDVDRSVIQKLLNLKHISDQNADLNASTESSTDVYSDTSTSESESEDGSLLAFRKMLLNVESDQENDVNIYPRNPPRKKRSRVKLLSNVISEVLGSIPVAQEVSVPIPLKHFTRRYVGDTKIKESLPVRVMTMSESCSLYPEIPHSWLCDGKLLRLLEANHPGNYRIFQDQWRRGQPVLVSNVSNLLDMKLWHPDRFAEDFALEKNDLINCMNGKVVPNQPMGKFWEGFEHFSKRLKDEDGKPMLLKLKDWPPGEDFAELLPTRFQDLIKALPLGEYTKRDGRLNLASCLPECFVRPDLGPKMYNAYGSALHPTKGTTNLHMDISDAVNVMVYVGIPKDGDNDEHIKEALRAIDEAGCDILTRRRVRNRGELPGALWHIYTASDADKIRDLLNKVALERGNRLEPHHDPIHDQNWYLDGYLRQRLYKEYGVEGYAIVQCRGDAVFIPAGAPHQVRNLHNCIKVAEDFVSPENIANCFHLTQEFRELSDTHTNHEDKLQIKNIIYHAVKDALACMSGCLKNAIKAEDDMKID